METAIIVGQFVVTYNGHDLPYVFDTRESATEYMEGLVRSRGISWSVRRIPDPMELERMAARIGIEEVSISKSEVFTARQSFYQLHGRNVRQLVSKIQSAYSQAEVTEFGEIWKPLRDGSSVRNASHWYVKFKF